MTYRRGDVVLVWYPFATGVGGKRRPALVVQNDADNARLSNTIVAQITTNLSRAHEATHCPILVSTSAGASSGLLHDSLISCDNLVTLDGSRIQRQIGSLSTDTMQRVDEALRAALGLK